MTPAQILFLNGLVLLALLVLLVLEEIRTWVLRAEAKRVRQALLGIVERIRAGADHPDDVRMYCEQLLFVAERAGGMPHTPLALSPTDLTAIAQQVVQVLTPLAKQRKVQIAAHIPKSSVLVTGHPLLLRSALEEILRNAIEVSGPKSRVECTVVQAKTGATVTIADSGPGLSSRDLKNFGKLFYRGSAKANNETAGGIGAASAKHFLQHCKAKCDIESTRGKGAIVTIKLQKPTRGGHTA